MPPFAGILAIRVASDFHRVDERPGMATNDVPVAGPKALAFPDIDVGGRRRHMIKAVDATADFGVQVLHRGADGDGERLTTEFPRGSHVERVVLVEIVCAMPEALDEHFLDRVDSDLTLPKSFDRKRRRSAGRRGVDEELGFSGFEPHVIREPAAVADQVFSRRIERRKERIRPVAGRKDRQLVEIPVIEAKRQSRRAAD